MRPLSVARPIEEWRVDAAYQFASRHAPELYAKVVADVREEMRMGGTWQRLIVRWIEAKMFPTDWEWFVVSCLAQRAADEVSAEFN